MRSYDELRSIARSIALAIHSEWKRFAYLDDMRCGVVNLHLFPQYKALSKVERQAVMTYLCVFLKMLGFRIVQRRLAKKSIRLILCRD